MVLQLNCFINIFDINRSDNKTRCFLSVCKFSNIWMDILLFKLPETKGKTLEQMESLFSRRFQLYGRKSSDETQQIINASDSISQN